MSAQTKTANTSLTVPPPSLFSMEAHLTEARSTPSLTDKGSPALRLCQSAHPITSTLLLPVVSYDEPSPELTGDCPEAARHPTGEP